MSIKEGQEYYLFIPGINPRKSIKIVVQTVDTDLRIKTIIANTYYDDDNKMRIQEYSKTTIQERCGHTDAEAKMIYYQNNAGEYRKKIENYEERIVELKKNISYLKKLVDYDSLKQEYPEYAI